MPDIQSTRMAAAVFSSPATHTFPLSDIGSAYTAEDDKDTSLATKVVAVH